MCDCAYVSPENRVKCLAMKHGEISSHVFNTLLVGSKVETVVNLRIALEAIKDARAEEKVKT